MFVPNHTYYIVELYSMPDAVLYWCQERFGPEGVRWFARPPRIYFKNQQDHLMFLLKWA